MTRYLAVAALTALCLAAWPAGAQFKGPPGGGGVPKTFEPPKINPPPPPLGGSLPPTKLPPGFPKSGTPFPGGGAPGGGAPVGGGAQGCPPNCPQQPDAVEVAVRAAAGSVVFLHEQRENLRSIETITQHKARVEAALRILAASWIVPLPHVADAVQRDALIKQTRNELQTLLQQTLAAATALMVQDVRRLTPFKWNPFASARRAEVERMEREVIDTGNRARAEVASPSAFREVRAPNRGAVEFRSGTAMRQLRQIHQTKLWRGQ